SPLQRERGWGEGSPLQASLGRLAARLRYPPPQRGEEPRLGRALPSRTLPGRRRPLRAVIVIALGHFLERGRATDRAAGLAIDLRTQPRRFAAHQRIEDRAHARLGQILVIVVVD